jgi:hypothetical protein
MLIPLPADPTARELVRQYEELLDKVQLMREHIIEISVTVGPLTEKLDEVVAILQQFLSSSNSIHHRSLQSTSARTDYPLRTSE